MDFNVLVGIISGIGVVGSVIFVPFFTLKERVTKLEITIQKQEEENKLFKNLFENIQTALNDIKNAQIELKMEIKNIKEK